MNNLFDRLKVEKAARIERLSEVIIGNEDFVKWLADKRFDGEEDKYFGKVIKTSRGLIIRYDKGSYGFDNRAFEDSDKLYMYMRHSVTVIPYKDKTYGWQYANAYNSTKFSDCCGAARGKYDTICSACKSKLH